eukprot:PITA_08855
MASSSSASTSYSPPPWDIFINHRGPDVKKTFASYLYRRLIDRSLRVFLDKEELEAGQNIPSQIQQAILGASLHIAIFSPTYAESTWCLDELVLMVESVKSGKIILPVFYKVQPSVLRHTVKDGAYAYALRKLEGKTAHDPETGEEKPRYNSDSFRKWRDALSFVADISGFVILDDDDEGELLDKVVESVLKSVPKPLLEVAKYPTGLNQKLEEFETTVLQKQETERVEAKVVGIWGVGGVGKTTLAKAFFNLRRSHYSKSSFVFNVRETIKRNSVNYLQSKLLKDLADMQREIESVDEGVGILRKYLSSCHALIVVDDVDDASQIDALLSFRAVLNPGSLILATTRDKHVLRSSQVLESSIYNMKGLSQLHSTELFCCYALNQPSPSQEFADLTDRFVKACDGLPLSLKVFGALVCGQSECYWKETLDELDKILPDTEIQESLKISYDSLSLDEQQIFLDIASFFIGEERDFAIRIWGLRGFQNLQDKCLLDVDAENSIRMHDHIHDLARNIAQGSGTRRLWEQSTKDIDDLLEQSSHRMIEVRGITMWSDPEVAVTMGIPRRKRKRHSRSCGILNLEFVATEDRCLERILEKARSPNLRWLRWLNCPYSSLPPWIPMEKLRVLDVAGFKLETLWQEESEAPLQLRELRVWADSSFSKFPKSIGQLKYLEKITISGAPKMLKSLPEEFCELHCLKYLDLGNFKKITSLPDSFGRLTRLQHINLHDAESLRRLPESFGNLTQLKSLELRGCSILAFSGTTLGNITTLEYLNISYCHNVTELPTQVEHQLSLKELHMGGDRLEELPSWIGNLCNLEILQLLYCGIKHLPFKRIEEERELNKLESFHDDDKCFFALKEILLRGTAISEVFFSGCVCPNLQSLRLTFCRELTQIGGLCGLSKLQHLDISWCVRLEELPNLERLISLETLEVTFCSELRSIPGLGQLKKLRSLNANGCDEIVELSGAKHLMLLEELWACYCPKLRWGEGELEQLRQRGVFVTYP